ncbi:MAG: ion channel, partial [Hyphomicrobiales bacterium]
LYIMFIHTIEVWLWAGVLLLVGAIDALEPAVYFSLTTYATIGFGDITIGPEWRLLSALIGANGLILFGWSVAYMVELVRRTA